MCNALDHKEAGVKPAVLRPVPQRLTIIPIQKRRSLIYCEGEFKRCVPDELEPNTSGRLLTMLFGESLSISMIQPDRSVQGKLSIESNRLLSLKNRFKMK